MILKALYDYYNRCGNLAPTGMELKEISFVIVLDNNGNFVNLEDRRIDKNNSQKFLVKKGATRTSGISANTLWDNSSYVLGFTEANLPYDESKLSEEKRKKNEEKRRKECDKNIKCNKAFIEKMQDLYAIHPDSKELKAINLFYSKGIQTCVSEIQQSSSWQELSKKLTCYLSFLIKGDTELIAEKTELYGEENFEKAEKESSNLGICLITGERNKLVTITTATSLPRQTGGKLVSFQVDSGYDSYGKKQGFNAPISEDTEFKYTTALNKLLGKGSHNKFNIGDRTFLFWASSNSDASLKSEEGLFDLLGFTNDETNDPNRRIEQIREAFNSIYSGILPTNSDDKFYFLGLAPNSARIAVIYWEETTLKIFAKRILQHFSDMDIIDTRTNKKPYFGLYQIISGVALNDDVSKAQPNLPDTVIRSIVQGIKYPYTLFTACIRRIRAEQQVTIGRAGIIKAYLNRLNDNNKKIEIMVDKENKNQGYLCGRLFATLEYLQECSNNRTSTIRSRYMNAASATPAAVFSTLLNLSVHHSEKLDKGIQIYFEQIKSEIIDKISPDGVPAHLNIQDQGRFMVGYYHQRQEFYTKKSDSKENNVE